MENLTNDIPKPLIDLAPLSSPECNENDFLQIGKEIVRCFEDVGFAYLKNVGIQTKEIEEYVKASDKLFDLDFEIQKKYYRDFDSLHGFSTDITELVDPDFSTEKRSTRYMYDIQSFDEPFPDEVPELKAAALPIAEKLGPITKAIIKAVEVGLDFPAGFLVNKHNDFFGLESFADLKVIKYLPPLTNKQVFRFEPHCDNSTVTLQLYGNLGGLQILDVKGNWHEAKLYSGYSLLFPSEELQMLTGNRIKAAKHQVLNPSDDSSIGRIRHSVLFFANVDHDADLRPFNHSDDCPKITGKEFTEMGIRKYLKKLPSQEMKKGNKIPSI